MCLLQLICIVESLLLELKILLSELLISYNKKIAKKKSHGRPLDGGGGCWRWLRGEKREGRRVGKRGEKGKSKDKRGEKLEKKGRWRVGAIGLGKKE